MQREGINLATQNYLLEKHLSHPLIKGEAVQPSLVSLIPIFCEHLSINYQLLINKIPPTRLAIFHIMVQFALYISSPLHISSNFYYKILNQFARSKVGWGNLKFTSNFSGKVYRWQAVCVTTPKNLELASEGTCCWNTAYSHGTTGKNYHPAMRYLGKSTYITVTICGHMSVLQANFRELPLARKT